MSVARPDTAGKTRVCPHCKATILESLTICPGCLHHLRFDQQASNRQAAAASALRVEGVIEHPPTSKDPWEYFVVVAVRNDRGEEITRHVVNVGALHGSEKRSFALSVEVMPLQTVAVPPKKPAVTQPPAATPRPPLRDPRPPARPPATATVRPAPASTAPAGVAAKPGAGTTAPAGAPNKPATGPTAPPKR